MLSTSAPTLLSRTRVQSHFIVRFRHTMAAPPFILWFIAALFTVYLPRCKSSECVDAITSSTDDKPHSSSVCSHLSRRADGFPALFLSYCQEVRKSWYDTIRDAIITCVRKPTSVSLIYRTEPTTKKCKTEKLKSNKDMLRSKVNSLENSSAANGQINNFKKGEIDLAGLKAMHPT